MVEKIKHFLEISLFSYKDFELSIGDIAALLILFALTKVLVFLLKTVIQRYVDKSTEKGRGFAVFQLARYFIYTIAIVLGLDFLGINISIFIASSAALFVGIGLGLQSIFNDIVSGLFLLFERSVEVGHVLEVDGLVGRVTDIRIRTSTIQTRDNIMMVVPNSHLITNSVINWSKDNKATRFSLKVGVAYGSDTRQVESLLIEAAKKHPEVLQQPLPFVKFIDFGDSALIFEIVFWSENGWQVEITKSDVRFEIDRLFRKNNITIPFPQRDLHIKSSPDKTD
ncbi:MAG: mechanosensitive ion channel [Flavobacteriales bacterium]|jgi:small-conductance mechanosensitive channel|nr:mechanosensitive ion channel [Flavobacteriales bacterium]